jgi:hypothetical protein
MTFILVLAATVFIAELEVQRIGQRVSPSRPWKQGKSKDEFDFSYTLYFKSRYALYLQERVTDYSTTLYQLPNVIVNMRMNGE